MAKTKTQTRTYGQADGGLALVSRIFVAALLVAAPLAFADGFSRYEGAKTGIFLVLGIPLVAVWLVRFCVGRHCIGLGGGFTVGIGYLLLLLGAASYLWTPAFYEGMIRLFLMTVLFGVVAEVATLKNKDWAVVPLVVAGVSVATIVILQRVDVSFPPVMLTGLASDAGAHGTFDHGVFAGWFLIVVAPLGFFLGSERSGLKGHLPMLAGVVMYFAAGLVGGWVATIGVGALLFGAIVGIKRLLKPSHRVGLAFLMAGIAASFVAQFAVGPQTGEETEQVVLETSNLYRQHRVDGPENAIMSFVEWDFERARSFELFGDKPIFGHGVGSWDYYLGNAVDSEHPYYLADRDEYHIHQTPVGWLNGLSVELGLAGLALGFLFLVGVAVNLRRGFSETHNDNGGPGMGYLAAAFFGAVFVCLSTTGAYHAGEGVAVFGVFGLVLGLGNTHTGSGFLANRVVSPAKGVFSRFERWVMLGLPALALLFSTGWVTVRAVAGDYYQQQGEVFMDNDRMDSALDSFQQATSIWGHDAITQYYLGLGHYYAMPNDLEAARTAIDQASRLRPYDVRIGLQQVRIQMLNATGTFEGGLENAARSRNRLRELRQRDPLNVELLQELADAYQALAEYDEATAMLLEVIQLVDEPNTLARTHYALGQLLEDELHEPDLAQEHFHSALEHVRGGTGLERNILERLSGAPPDEHQH